MSSVCLLFFAIILLLPNWRMNVFKRVHFVLLSEVLITLTIIWCATTTERRVSNGDFTASNIDEVIRNRSMCNDWC